MSQDPAQDGQQNGPQDAPQEGPQDGQGRRSTFAPVLLTGVAASALAAVAAGNPWATLGADADLRGFDVRAVETAGEVPVASALSLVLLAAWGALLVTRGRVRRTLAVVGVLGGLALVAVVVHGGLTTPDAVREALDTQFALPEGTSADAPVGRTGWLWTAAVAAVAATAAFALAVREAPRWPAMGARYDAPGAPRSGAAPARDDRPASNQDLWKALDEGEDPTTGPAPRPEGGTDR